METTPTNTNATNDTQRQAEIDAELATLRAQRAEVEKRRQQAADKRDHVGALERERLALSDAQAIEQAENDIGADGEKIRIVKFRRRKHFRKETGHRQHYTEIEIVGITGAGKKE